MAADAADPVAESAKKVARTFGVRVEGSTSSAVVDILSTESTERLAGG